MNTRMKHDRRTETTGYALLLAAALFTAGCASTGKGTRPDDMSAAAHRRAAAKDRKQAARHERMHDNRGPTNVGPTAGPTGIEYTLDAYDPSHAHAAEAARHQRHARQHAEAALTLERFERAQCKGFPKKTRVLCPLLGQLAAVKNDARGVVLTLTPKVSAKAVLAHMRCHHAFGRTTGRKGMDRCPLYLENIEFGLTRDGKQVFIHVGKTASEQMLTRLRHRIRAHLPKAAPAK